MLLINDNLIIIVAWLLPLYFIWQCAMLSGILAIPPPHYIPQNLIDLAFDWLQNRGWVEYLVLCLLQFLLIS